MMRRLMNDICASLCSGVVRMAVIMSVLSCFGVSAYAQTADTLRHEVLLETSKGNIRIAPCITRHRCTVTIS